MSAAVVRSARSGGSPVERLLVLVLAAVGILATGALAVVDPFDPAASLLDLVGDVAFVVSLLAFVLSGAVILLRRPDNRIGWLLLAPGVVMPVAEVTSRWLVSMGPPAEMSPLLWLVLWVGGWSWVVLAFGIFHLLLTFPTGRLLTPRWRWAVALEVVLIATVVVLGAVSDPIGPMVNGEPTWTVANPIGLVDGDAMDTALGLVWGIGLLTICALSASAVVLRFRRGTLGERQQLKWPLAAAILFGLIYGLGVVAAALEAEPSPGAPDAGANPVDALLGFGLAAIPVSVAIAILRYRLYEIDRIISRTIAWAIVSGILIAGFAVTIVAVQSLLTRVTGGQTLAVAASTLLVAAVAQPLLRAVQRVVDRRFNRARYDAQRTADAFAERLRGQVDLADLQRDLGGVVTGAVHPRSAGLWLRERGEAAP